MNKLIKVFSSIIQHRAQQDLHTTIFSPCVIHGTPDTAVSSGVEGYTLAMQVYTPASLKATVLIVKIDLNTSGEFTPSLFLILLLGGEGVFH